MYYMPVYDRTGDAVYSWQPSGNSCTFKLQKPAPGHPRVVPFLVQEVLSSRMQQHAGATWNIAGPVLEVEGRTRRL